ncbi:MAG: hypothetical protein PHT31_07025 [Candidatus Omnitrophica bacterium]|nr:hypothetical protein [Candidatus Omnitrophota bacterium]MDD5653891.1 hypothetical protein [Candidatus Omnitrophota bacterium]
MEKTRKKWRRAELIILTKNNNKEGVLGYCKSAANPSVTVFYSNGKCDTLGGHTCIACNATGPNS